jgi:hypothetical protein
MLRIWQFVRTYLWPRIAAGEPIAKVAPTLAVVSDGSRAGRGVKQGIATSMEEACGEVWRSSSYLGDEDSKERYNLFR